MDGGQSRSDTPSLRGPDMTTSKDSRLSVWPVHPVLFGCSVMLSLGATSDQVAPGMIVNATMAIGVVAALVTGIGTAMCRRPRFAGLLATPLVGLFLFSETLADVFGLVVVLFLALSAWLWWRAEEAFLEMATAGMNVFCAALAFMTFSSLVFLAEPAPDLDPLPVPHLASQNAPPNIVHILLDGYGDPDLLAVKQGCELSIREDLEALGFRVPRGVRSNYPQTLQSTASVFSMQLLQDMDMEPLGREKLRWALGHSPVENGLINGGYQIEQYAPEYPNVLLGQGGVRSPLFATNFFDYTVLSIGASTTASRLVGLPPSSLAHRLHRRSLRWTLTHAREAFGRDPTFRFVHVVAPHPPFVVAADGAYRPDQAAAGIDDASQWASKHGGYGQYAAGYCAKASWISDEVVSLATSLIESDPSVVMVIHGDHGPGHHIDHENIAVSDIEGRFGVLLAVRAPAKATDRLRDGMTLVNLYPALLGGLFDVELDARPDRHFWSGWHDQGVFTEVTDAL